MADARPTLPPAHPQVLVLAPTREIALQASEAVALCAGALPPPGLACGSFIGGLRVDEDEKQLRRCALPILTAADPGLGCALGSSVAP